MQKEDEDWRKRVGEKEGERGERGGGGGEGEGRGGE